MSNTVPNDWEAASLRELCKFSGGSAFKEKYQGRRRGEYPFIKVSDMTIDGNQRFITNANHWIDQATKIEAKIKLFPASSVVFAKVGAALLLNRRRILTRETAIDNNMMAAIPNSDDNNFLYYVLQEVDLREIVQGGAVPSVNQAQMEDIPTLIPPLPEQQKIAAILSSVDNVIEKTRAQIDKLKDLKTGMMQELLTQGIGHTEFKDSPVGRVPAHWNVVELREFCKLQNGYAFKSEDFSQTGTPLIRISNIKNNGIQVNHDVCISDPSIPDRFFVHAGDSLIAMSGATTGKTGCYRLKQKAVLNQRVGRFVPLTGRSDNRWIRHLVQTDWFTDAILIDAAGGAQPNISSSQIESILCALPPLDEQAQIAKSLDSVDIRREAEASKLVSLTNLKRALMQDLLTGKVRVNPL